MRSSFCAFAVLAASMLAPSAARAQYVANNYVWKLSATTYEFQTGLNTPVACDSKMLSGMLHWNNASAFKINQSGQFFSGYINPASTKIQVSMEPGINMSSGANNLAEAQPGSYVSMTTVEGQSIQVLRSAHIRINHDRWAAGKLYCGGGTVPSDAWDYAYVVGHEAGHVLGVDHGNPALPTTCVIGAPLPAGRPLFARCSTETTRARNLYGAP